jgi:hypothetical protein
VSNHLPVTRSILSATYQLQEELRRRVNRLVQETQELCRKQVREYDEEAGDERIED